MSISKSKYIKLREAVEYILYVIDESEKKNK